MLQRLAMILWIVFFLGGICRPLTAQNVDHRFRIENIHLQEGERIEGVDISIRAGDFVAVSGLPAGWLVTIDNDPSWQTSLKGDAKVGAAMLDAENIGKLTVLVHRFEFGDLKFQISGVLLVTTNFQNVRKVPLSVNNFKEVLSAGPQH